MKFASLVMLIGMMGILIISAPAIIATALGMGVNDLGGEIYMISGIFGALIIFIALIWYIGKAASTGAMHIIEPSKSSEVLWLFCTRGGHIKIIPAVHESQTMMRTQDREMYAQDPGGRTTNILAGHDTRIILETVQSAVSPPLAGYATKVAQKTGAKSLFSLHQIGLRIMKGGNKGYIPSEYDEAEKTNIVKNEDLKNHITLNPVKKGVLAENVAGEVLDLNDYEKFQIYEGSPVGFKTLIRAEKYKAIFDKKALDVDKRGSGIDMMKYISMLITGVVVAIMAYIVIGGYL